MLYFLKFALSLHFHGNEPLSLLARFQIEVIQKSQDFRENLLEQLDEADALT
jgi:hypothetical protein